MPGHEKQGRSRWPRYQPLVLAAVAFAAGIAADRASGLRIDAWIATGLIAWCGWFVARRRPFLSTALLAIAVAASGGAWHHEHWFLTWANEIGLYADETPQPACLEAVALDSPRHFAARPPNPLRAIRQKDRSQLLVRVVSLRDADRWLPASGITQVWVDGALEGVARGDRLRIVGQLSTPTGPQNPGEFDFARHARADHQFSRLAADFADCVTVIERGERWSLDRLFAAVRRRGDEFLWRQIAPDQAALASALLLGVRDELDEETNLAFAKTGTIHLLSISGLHVGILSAFLFGILRLGLIGRRLALAFVAIITLGYALVISAEPPAVRATIVVLLMCAAALLRQRPLSFNLLAAGALAVFVMNPCDLFRIGPQLSFLAMAALIWSGTRFAPQPIADPLDRLIAQTRPWPMRWTRRRARGLLHATAIGFCVWATGAPLVLSQFHLFSPATLILTPVLALPVSAALISGFLLLTVGSLVWPLGVVCAKLCDWSLWAIDGATGFAASISWSHLWAPGPAFWWLAGFYLALAACVVLPSRLPPPRWRLAGFAGWMAIGFLVPLTGRANPRLECTFLSVGHGCAVLLELPGGEKLLYDAGRLGSPEAGARSIAAYLWHRGITRLDAIVLSHADVDHYNAVPELLTKFRVGTVYATPAMLMDEGDAMQTLVAAVNKAGVPLKEIWSGDRLRVGGDCLLEVWHPTRRGVIGSDNANSLVLDVEYQGRRILLTGDLESPGIDDLLAESPCHCDVVLTPHHGSARSNPPGFAAWSTPGVAIVSGSANDRRPEVDRAYRASGACVLNTADCGAVHLAVTRARIDVSTWKPATIDQTLPGPHQPAESIAAYRP